MSLEGRGHICTACILVYLYRFSCISAFILSCLALIFTTLLACLLPWLRTQTIRYGEDRYAERIAHAIVEARRKAVCLKEVENKCRTS